MSQPIAAPAYPVLLFFEQGLERKYAEQTAAWFDRFPGPVTVQIGTPPVFVKPNADGELAWGDIFGALEKLRQDKQISPTTFLFLLTKTPNENNWYAAEDPGNMRNGFGHVGDFSWVTSAPASIIAAHYTLKGIFNTLLDEEKLPWQEMWHQQSRGCFFDFCENKWDLSLKLRTADICGDCMHIFQSVGIPDSLLKQTVAIMEASRTLAINTGQFLDQKESYNEWPFPVAITRHKVVQTQNPLLRFILLLNHFDSLVRYFYLAHEVDAGRLPAQVNRPSLGWWVDQLATSLRGERNFREVVRIAETEKVVNLRNERLGHGWMSANEESYREEAERLEGTIGQIEDELRPFFEKHRLLIPRQFHLSEGGWVVEGENLLGSHILHPPFRMESTEDPRLLGIASKNEVYLTDNRMRAFRRISPYIRSAICPECRHPRVLITDGGSQFIDVFMGHRVEL
jgi:hypothetical protein